MISYFKNVDPFDALEIEKIFSKLDDICLEVDVILMSPLKTLVSFFSRLFHYFGKSMGYVSSMIFTLVTSHNIFKI